MKKASFYFVMAGVFMLSTASMCSSDDNSSTSQDPAVVVNTVTQGTWHVSAFTEDGVDHTNYFTGYNFTFAAANLLTAANGTDTVTGGWSVANTEDSGDDHPSLSDLDFNIVFASPANFSEITEDWTIMERTDTKIRLQHISGGNGGTELLTFEKN